MSIVEKAIKKQRQGQSSHDRAPQTVFGTVHPVGDWRPRGAASSPQKMIRIDQSALRAEGLLPPEHQAHQIAQQYRQIKRPLIANVRERVANGVPNGAVIVMASAMPGEGKTFTAINLAFSMAQEQDLRVLLIDADAPKPHISRLFGGDNEPGLLDALRDTKLDAESLVLGTDVPNLQMLPAGRRSENATELLASRRMAEVLAELFERDRQRIILMDSPPLVLTTESQVLLQHAGEVVVVVRAESTPQQVVLDALSHVGKDKPVALLLNQSMDEGIAGYYYGYGHEEEGQAAATPG